MKASVQDKEGTDHYIWLKEGVPQGGVLSPILFLLLMDLLDEMIQKDTKAKTIMYADDILLIGEYKEVEKALTVCTKWADITGIKFSPQKCTSICDHGEDLLLNHEVVPRVNEARYLGLNITLQDISDTSVKDRTTKAMAAVRKLQEWSKINPHTTHPIVLRNLYYIFVQSTLKYGTRYLSPHAMHELQRIDEEMFTRLANLGLRIPYKTMASILAKRTLSNNPSMKIVQIKQTKRIYQETPTVKILELLTSRLAWMCIKWWSGRWPDFRKVQAFKKDNLLELERCRMVLASTYVPERRHLLLAIRTLQTIERIKAK